MVDPQAIALIGGWPLELPVIDIILIVWLHRKSIRSG